MSELAEDLRRHIYMEVRGYPPGPARWTMSLEWLNEVRKLPDALTPNSVFLTCFPLGGSEYLLGIPIEIREDGGPPHLELCG